MFSAQEAEQIIQHVYDAILPGGTIAIIGLILEDSRHAPVQIVMFNMVFINTYDAGQAYTEGEYRSWLQRLVFVMYLLKIIFSHSVMH